VFLAVICNWNITIASQNSNGILPHCPMKLFSSTFNSWSADIFVNNCKAYTKQNCRVFTVVYTHQLGAVQTLCRWQPLLQWLMLPAQTPLV
jgi:hypothetical protein